MPSEAVDVDHGQFVGRTFERFAEVCQGLTARRRSHPGLHLLTNLRFDEGRLQPAVSSKSDVATTPRADPVGRLVSGEHVADLSDAAIFTAPHGEPFQREGRPGGIPQEVFQALKIARAYNGNAVSFLTP